ncbi:Os04g0605925, partial [Oryza sativa Japonica Group]
NIIQTQCANNELMELVHPSDEFVDVVLTVTSITTLNVVVPLLLQPTQWCLQLEWPEEVVGLLEMWANSHDLMNKILNADDIQGGKPPR